MKWFFLLMVSLLLMASTLNARGIGIKIGGNYTYFKNKKTSSEFEYSTNNINCIFKSANSGSFISHESCSRHNFLSSIRLDKRLSNRKKGNHALWLQGGFGAASIDIYDRNHPSELFFHGEFSVHFRRHHKTISIGVHEEVTETWGIKTLWGTYGYSYSRPWLESTLSAGIGVSQWYHHTESDRGTIYSPHVPSLIIRAQTILHLRQIFGFGLVLASNVNRESSYLAGGIVFTLGLWNW